MLKLALIGIVALIILLAFVIIIRNKPDLWFWIFLNLYFDPGGYVYEMLDGALLGPLHISDVFIFGMVICMRSADISWKVIFSDQFLTKFLLALFIFSLYYFIVYGGIVPYLHNDFDYLTFLIKNRTYVYALIILISVYAFSLRSLKYFYSTTLFIGVICLSLYLITLFTGIPLIPVWELLREGTDMTRVTMLSYGLFYLLFPLSLIVFLLSRKLFVKLKYKPWLYYGGLVMIITLLITLTRRTQIDIIGVALIIVLVISYLFRLGKISGMLKLMVPAVIVMIVLYFTFPDYTDYIKRTGEDTFLILTTGRNIHGESEERVTSTGDLEITKKYIKENFILGTGYTYLYWGPGYASSARGPVYSRAADAAGEVNIYYLFFGFGLVGAILILPLYYMMGLLSLRLIKLLRLTITNYLQDPITIIFSIYLLVVMIPKFTYKIMGLSSEFMIASIGGTAVVLGLGYALYRKLFLNYYFQDSIK